MFICIFLCPRIHHRLAHKQWVFPKKNQAGQKRTSIPQPPPPCLPVGTHVREYSLFLPFKTKSRIAVIIFVIQIVSSSRRRSECIATVRSRSRYKYLSCLLRIFSIKGFSSFLGGEVHYLFLYCETPPKFRSQVQYMSWGGIYLFSRAPGIFLFIVHLQRAIHTPITDILPPLYGNTISQSLSTGP